MKKGFIYILRSLKNNRLYIGSTNDMDRRIHQHEIGNVKTTRNLMPLKLQLFQECDNIRVARKFEQRLKKLKRKDYIEKIIKDGVIKMRLP